MCQVVYGEVFFIKKERERERGRESKENFADRLWFGECVRMEGGLRISVTN